MPDILPIYTSLKNADLACISAKLAIQQYLNVSELKDLKRYTKWTLTGSDLSDTLLRDILENSYYIANPNKEHARLSALPSHSKWTQYHATIRLKDGHIDTYTRDKINATFNCAIECISKSTVWCLFTDADHHAHTQDQLYRQIVYTDSQSQGLLANPLYEDIQFSHYSV